MQIRSVMMSYCLQLKMVKYWINDISGNIEAVFLKLGTINVHHKKNTMTPLNWLMDPPRLFMSSTSLSQFWFVSKKIFFPLNEVQSWIPKKNILHCKFLKPLLPIVLMIEELLHQQLCLGVSGGGSLAWFCYKLNCLTSHYLRYLKIFTDKIWTWVCVHMVAEVSYHSKRDKRHLHASY